ncbi:hypothetical protein GGP97_002764 [Salinibacter ruber]|nr:hypothetical protein [Salinibacter ruber]
MLLEICWADDGWNKLCSFLDVEIPAQEVPHENKGRSQLTSLLSYTKGYLKYRFRR